jgi:hypothetical protein
MNKSDLLETLRRTHDEFLAAINTFAPEQMAQVHLTGSWTPQDILAHVTRWEEICAHYLRAVIAGDPIPLLDGTSEELNARHLAADRLLTLTEVWTNSDASFNAVLAMVESLTEEQLAQVQRGPWIEFQHETLPLDKIIGIDTYEHYPMHVADINTWRTTRGPTP